METEIDNMLCALSAPMGNRLLKSFSLGKSIEIAR
jgi:hypothetical protein